MSRAGDPQGKRGSGCRYRLLLEYDGTGFSGWQIQKNARTIQGAIVEAAQDLFGGVVDVQGAGRTDAGVHALAQVAHLQASHRLAAPLVLAGLNERLPAAINVLQVENAPASFHARHDARQKAYLYLISRRRTAFGKRYVWWVKEDLDAARMEEAAGIFCGFHDFNAFADKRIDKHLSTKVAVARTEVAERGDLILFRIVASHFLWRMVRRIVGITVEAGRGRVTPDQIRGILAGASPLTGAITAPASGLFLFQVLYEGESLNPLALPPFPGL